MFSFFSTPRSRKQKLVSVPEVIDQIQKAPPNEHVPLFQDLQTCIPEKTAEIFAPLLNHMVSALMRPDADLNLKSVIIEILFRSVKQADESDPERDPFPFIAKHATLPIALLNNLYPYNAKVMYLIEVLYMRDPRQFIDFISKTPDCVLPMIRSITENGDPKMADLFFRLAVANVTLLDKISGWISAKLRMFPVSTAIDFMVASPRFRDVISDSEIEQWMLSHSEYSISDVLNIVDYYRFLWQRNSILTMLSRTKPIEKRKMVNWIHEKPAQSVKMDQSAAEFALNSLLNPKYDFHSEEKIVKGVHEFEDSSEGYAFVRIYALSFADPNTLPPEQVLDMLNMILDTHEYIAGAVAQLIIIWVMAYDYKPPLAIVYQTAGAAFDEQRSEALRYLYKALLRILGKEYELAVSITSSEPSLDYEHSYESVILAAPWSFPHFPEYLSRILHVKMTDFSDSMRVLGWVVDYLSMQPTDPAV